MDKFISFAFIAVTGILSVFSFIFYFLLLKIFSLYFFIPLCHGNKGGSEGAIAPLY